MQGDVVAIYNESGAKVASYVYDAWGNFTTTYHNGGASLTPVIKNPLLYRGYYYDRDLGMYYLQTRYYDSNIGRFLNADSYVSTGQGILGHNMYAYCNNNPVMYVDPTGELWEAVLFNPYALVAVAAVLVLSALLIDAMTEQAFGKAVTDTVSNIFESDDSNVEADEKTTTIAAPKEYNYWTATIQNNVVTPGTPLTYSEAREWVAKENDLLCKDHAAAFAIVKFYPSAIWEPGHYGGIQCGYLNHYHLSSAHKNHIWYYGE